MVECLKEHFKTVFDDYFKKHRLSGSEPGKEDEDSKTESEKDDDEDNNGGGQMVERKIAKEESIDEID